MSFEDFYGACFAFGGGELLRQMIKHLVKNGADVNLKNREGYTPLFMIVYNFYFHDDFAELVELFVKKGAKIDELDKDGKTALELVYGKKQDILDYDIVVEFLRY